MVVGRTDHLPGGAAPNWVSPKQGSGLMARHAVTLSLPQFGPIRANAVSGMYGQVPRCALAKERPRNILRIDAMCAAFL